MSFHGVPFPLKALWGMLGNGAITGLDASFYLARMDFELFSFFCYLIKTLLSRLNDYSVGFTDPPFVGWDVPVPAPKAERAPICAVA